MGCNFENDRFELLSFIELSNKFRFQHHLTDSINFALMS